MKPSNRSLGIGIILLAIFVASFYFFYRRAENKLQEPLIRTSAVINQPLPKANLVNISGKVLDDEKLRRGKVILVFTMTDCEPCNDENEFLKTVIGSREIGRAHV